MTKTWHRYSLFLLAFPMIMAWGCSKSPKQYQSEDPAQVDGSALERPAQPGLTAENGSPDGLFKLQGQEGSSTRNNSQADIVYGQGAGGISFSTTYQESTQILSEPEFGPLEDGRTWYPEGMMIRWRTDQPTHPKQIFLLTGYLGSLHLPEPYGALKLGQSLAGQFSGAPVKKAQELARTMYRHFEKTSKDYDCLTERKCAVIPTNEDFIFLLPSMTMFVANDEYKRLHLVILKEELSAGDFGQTFDWLKGEVIRPNVSAIGLGESWGAINHQSEFKAKTEVDGRNFTNVTNTAYVYTTRSHFEDDYLKPDERETLNGLLYLDLHSEPILINGKYVQVKKLSSDQVELELVDEPSAPMEDFRLQQAKEQEALVKLVGEETAKLAEPYLNEKSVHLLTAKMKFLVGQPKLQKQFLNKLLKLMKREIEAEFGGPNTKWFEKRTAFNREGKQRYFHMAFGFYNEAQSRGRLYGVGLSESSGGLSISTFLLDDEFDSLVMPMANATFKAGSGQLAGFQLGDQLQLDQIDLNRKETTLTYEKDGRDLKNRFAFDVDESLSIAAYSAPKINQLRLEVDLIEDVSGVELGVARANDDAKSTSASLRSIRTSNWGVGISQLCQLPDFVARIGMSEAEFKNGLDQAIQKAKQRKKAAEQKLRKALSRLGSAESAGREAEAKKLLSEEEQAYLKFDESCRAYAPEDPNRTGRVPAYYFPKQGVKLIFDMRELTEIMVYATQKGGA